MLDEPGYAAPYVEQCVPLIEECQNENLKLDFEICFARHLDFSRKFLQAASFYYQCSVKMQAIPGIVGFFPIFINYFV